MQRNLVAAVFIIYRTIAIVLGLIILGAHTIPQIKILTSPHLDTTNYDPFAGWIFVILSITTVTIIVFGPDILLTALASGSLRQLGQIKIDIGHDLVGEPRRVRLSWNVRGPEIRPAEMLGFRCGSYTPSSQADAEEHCILIMSKKRQQMNDVLDGTADDTVSPSQPNVYACFVKATSYKWKGIFIKEQTAETVYSPMEVVRLIPEDSVEKLRRQREEAELQADARIARQRSMSAAQRRMERWPDEYEVGTEEFKMRQRMLNDMNRDIAEVERSDFSLEEKKKRIEAITSHYTNLIDRLSGLS